MRMEKKENGEDHQMYILGKHEPIPEWSKYITNPHFFPTEPFALHKPSTSALYSPSLLINFPCTSLEWNPLPYHLTTTVFYRKNE